MRLKRLGRCLPHRKLCGLLWGWYLTHWELERTTRIAIKRNLFFPSWLWFYMNNIGHFKGRVLLLMPPHLCTLMLEPVIRTSRSLVPWLHPLHPAVCPHLPVLWLYQELTFWDWAWWCVLVVLTTEEAKTGGSLDPRSSTSAWATWETPKPISKT